MNFTNKKDIPLALAVWLMHDEYDYVNTPNYISATGLMKPLRHIILAKRVVGSSDPLDLEDMVAKALGHSLHDSIEKAWVKGYKTNLKKLGYPAGVIERVRVNPTDEELQAVKDCIPVYIEQRAMRQINGFTIGGKFDMVAEGIVHDNKSTTAYSWVYGGRDDDYALQGSIYRWLNPEKITEDFIRINYIFTDWQKAQVSQNPRYPDSRLKAKEIPLLSIEDTEQWILDKLAAVTRYMDAPEKDIPHCTPEELWMSDPTYKYYANAENTSGRSTKNCDTLPEAQAYKQSKGNKGVIITVQAEPKRCGYCDAYSVCTQKDKYFS